MTTSSWQPHNLQVIGELASDQLPEAQKAAVGLAAKYKFDLNTAFELVGKAAKGNTATLARYGIVLGEGLSQAEKFNELLRQGAEGFALAEAEANTTYGAVEQLNNLWGDFKEMLGTYFLPALGQVAGALADIIKLVNGTSSAQKIAQKEAAVLSFNFEFLTGKLLDYKGAAELSNIETEEMERFIKDINEAYPAYFDHLDLHEAGYNDIAKAVNGAREELNLYLDQMAMQAVMEDFNAELAKNGKKIYEVQKKVKKYQDMLDAGQTMIMVGPDDLRSVQGYIGLYNRQIDVLREKQVELKTAIMDITESMRPPVLPPVKEKKPADDDPGKGKGSGTTAATKAEVSQTAKAYEKLLENLRKYHSDSALANLSSHQKELAQLNIKFEEEQQVILNALAAKEITEADAQISLAAIRSKYDAEARQVQKKADDEVIALAQKRIENSVKDEEQYYEMMRFQDDGYYEWKKKKIEDQVMAMAIGNAEKIALIKVFLDELDALKEEYDFTEPAKKGGWFFSGLLGFDPDSPEDQEKLGAMQDTYRNLVSSASGMVSGLVRLSAQRRDQEISDLDAKAAKEGMTNDKLLTQKAEINKKFVDEEKKLKRIQKTIAIGQATINIAEGATKALAMGPIIGPIMAAMVTALGAAQIAIISAQKFASGGLFRGKGGPKDDQNLAYVSDGEYIVNAAATKKHMPLLEMINQAGRYSAGGRVGGTINNAISHSLFPSYGAAAGGASVAPMLNRIIEKIDILNLNLVKKKFTATVQSQGTSPGVREFDLTKHRMEERGYDPSFAQ